MRQKRYLPLFLFILALATIACTCGGFDLPFGGDDGAVATAVVEVDEPEPTDEPAPTEEPTPTEEPEPTATAEPTATPEPEPTPTEEAVAGEGELFEIEDQGIAFAVPEGWVTQLDEQSTGAPAIQLVSDESLLEDESEIPRGARVLLLTNPSFGELPPLESLNIVSALVLEEENDGSSVEIVSEPEVLEINGQEAAQTRIRVTDDQDRRFFAIVTVIRTDDNAAVVYGAVAEDDREEYLSQVEAVISSIVLSTPVGDSPAAGPLLQYAVVYTGEIAEGDTAAFTFEATAGEPVAIVATAGDGFDPILTIVNSEDQIVAEVDEGFPGEGEVIIFSAQNSGSYTAEVTEFGGDAGSFGIVVLPYADEGPGILLTDSDTVNDEAGIDYTITVNVGEAIIAVVQPLDDGFDSILRVYDLDGNIIADVDTSDSGEPETYIFFPEESGEYILNVAGWAGDTGAYELLIGGAPIAELE